MQCNPSNSVVHLTMRYNKEVLAVGSGVLYQKNDRFYIVTAWHNVTGRHPDTLKYLSNNGAVPNNVIAYISIRLYGDNYNEYLRRPITIPLVGDMRSLYLIHSQSWPRVDVAAIPIYPYSEYLSEYISSTGEKVTFRKKLIEKAEGNGLSSDIESIQHFESAISKIQVDFSQQLAASDDLFILGYPKGIIDYSGQPIWKRATVATSPTIGWGGQKKFLVDCASREGMSGAPTIFYSRKGNVQIGNSTYCGLGQVAYFHGVYTGRLGSTSELEAQIGTIWQRSLVDEIIDGTVQAPLPDRLEASPPEVRNIIDSTWPKSSEFASSVLKNKLQQDYYTFELMEELKGRANPEDVKDELLSKAKDKSNNGQDSQSK